MDKKRFYFNVINFTIAQLDDSCSSELIDDLQSYARELTFIISETKTHSTSDHEFRSNKIYDNFIHTFRDHHLDRQISLPQLEQLADKKLNFDRVNDCDLEYLACLERFMDKQLKAADANEKYYEPLDAWEVRYGQMKPSQRQARRAVKQNIVERIIDGKEKTTIVLGEPGSGKSVVLRWVIKGVAQRTATAAVRIIPIFIPLGKIEIPSEASLITSKWVLDVVKLYLTKNRVNHYSDAELIVAANYIGENLEQLLENGRCLIVFDGMDELPRHYYDEACKALLEFANKWTSNTGTNNRFILSCRERDYPEQFINVHRFVLYSFDLADVKNYIQLRAPQHDVEMRLKEVDDIWQCDGDGRKMLDNPFFLSLIASYIKQSSLPMPLTRGALFDDYVIRALRLRDEYELDKYSQSKTIIKLLEDLAFWLTKSQTSGTKIDRGRLESTAEGRALAEAIWTNKIDSNLFTFIEISNTNNSIVFKHHKLREYFTARAWKRLFFYYSSSDRERAYLATVSAKWWHFEIMVLLASMLKSESKVQDLLMTILTDYQNDKPDIRAILAATCLNASCFQTNEQFVNQVFAALTFALEKSDVSDPEKSKCWKAISKLHPNMKMVLAIPPILERSNRYLHEDALKYFLPSKEKTMGETIMTAKILMKQAVTSYSLLRIWRYREFLSSPALSKDQRQILNSDNFISLFLSLVVWVLLLLLTFGLAFYGFRSNLSWKTIPTILLMEIFSGIIIFWLFNEHERSLSGIKQGLKRVISRITSENLIERLLTAVVLVIVIVINSFIVGQFIYQHYGEQQLISQSEVLEQQVRVTTAQSNLSIIENKPVEKKKIEELPYLDAAAILEIGNEIGKSTDLPAYLTLQKLSKNNKGIIELAGQVDRRLILADKLRSLSAIVAESNSNHTLKRELIAQLCENYINRTEPEEYITPYLDRMTPAVIDKIVEDINQTKILPDYLVLQGLADNKEQVVKLATQHEQIEKLTSLLNKVATIERRSNTPDLTRIQLKQICRKSIENLPALDEWLSSFQQLHPIVIDEIAERIKETDDLIGYLLLQQLISDRQLLTSHLITKEYQERLSKEITNFSLLIEKSGDIYSIERKTLAEVCTKFIQNQDSNKKPSMEVFVTLLEDHRSKQIVTTEDLDRGSLPTSIFSTSEPAQNLLFLLSHNGYIEPATLLRVNETKDEDWLIGSARIVFTETNKLLSEANAYRVPKSSVQLALKRLTQALGRSELHNDAVASALVIMKEERERWISEQKAKQLEIQLAEQRFKSQMTFIVQCLILVILAVAGISLLWLYLMGFFLDKKDINKLRAVAANDKHNLRYRITAVKALAESNDSEANSALQYLNQLVVPEPLYVEIQYGLFCHDQRNERRRSSNAEGDDTLTQMES